MIPSQTGPDPWTAQRIWSHEAMSRVWGLQALPVGGWPPEVPRLRAPLQLDFGLGFDAAAGAHQAQLAGAVRAGRAVLGRRFGSQASAAARKRFYRLLRACCGPAAPGRTAARAVRSAIECDESTFGGARHNPRGWGALGKVIVPARAPCTTPTNGRPTPPLSCAAST